MKNESMLSHSSFLLAQTTPRHREDNVVWRASPTHLSHHFLAWPSSKYFNVPLSTDKNNFRFSSSGRMYGKTVWEANRRRTEIGDRSMDLVREHENAKKRRAPRTVTWIKSRCLIHGTSTVYCITVTKMAVGQLEKHS